MSVALGGVLGRIAFDLLRIRRSVTLANLEQALGSTLSRRERIVTARCSYINFAKSMVEFALLGRLTRERIGSLVRLRDFHHIDRALSRGSGALVVTGHFGSWELLGAATAARGYPVDFLVGQQSNRLVDDLMNGLRRKAGIGIISRGIAARGVLGSIKNNRIVALLSDQDARRMGMFVDFFGIPASTFQGAAQFAYRTGCPIFCVFIIRLDDGTHEAVCLPPIEVRVGSDRDEEVRRLTAEHTRRLEEYVTRYPGHYFWAHRRWKTRPPATKIP
jgi:KDO2-lipid IV(A) lauroyltransferase